MTSFGSSDAEDEFDRYLYMIGKFLRIRPVFLSEADGHPIVAIFEIHSIELSAALIESRQMRGASPAGLTVRESSLVDAVKQSTGEGKRRPG